MITASFNVTAAPPSAMPAPDGVVAPPPGFVLRKVRPWDDPIMNSYGYDVSRGGTPKGQFQVITVFVWSELLSRWAGQWSAIANYNKLTHADMLNLARMQLLEFGYPYSISDADLLAMKTKVLPDGWTLQQKMGWLYVKEPGAVMWGDSADWWNANEIRYGTMVNGGQLVAVAAATRTFMVQMPNQTGEHPVLMRELLTFKRSDFGKTHLQYPYLAQYATVANLPNNQYGETIKGHVICPAALNPTEFDFAGTFQPTHYYLPDVWLQ